MPLLVAVGPDAITYVTREGDQYFFHEKDERHPIQNGRARFIIRQESMKLSTEGAFDDWESLYVHLGAMRHPATRDEHLPPPAGLGRGHVETTLHDVRRWMTDGSEKNLPRARRALEGLYQLREVMDSPLVFAEIYGLYDRLESIE